jgi:hypothetical protein
MDANGRESKSMKTGKRRGRLSAFVTGGFVGICLSPLVTWQAFGSENWSFIVLIAAIFAVLVGSFAAFAAAERTEKLIKIIFGLFGA